MFDTIKSHELNVKYARGRACPWMTKKTADIRDSLLRFHNEIIEFYQYISATPAEREARKVAFLEYLLVDLDWRKSLSR